MGAREARHGASLGVTILVTSRKVLSTFREMFPIWEQIVTGFIEPRILARYYSSMGLEKAQNFQSGEVEWLHEEFLKRKKKNAKFSLRAFASFLNVPPGRLSEILSEKRALSTKLFHRIAARLGYSPSESRELFLRTSGPLDQASREKTLLSEDEFQVISDWEHFAILSLLNTTHRNFTIPYLGQRLGISVLEVRQALLRLERLGLVRKEGLKWFRTGPPLKTTTDVVSRAIRKAHKQMLERSIEALETIPVEQKEISSVTMAIDPKKLKEAKQKIDAFQSEMEALLETGNRSEVYYLAVQLIPLTKVRQP